MKALITSKKTFLTGLAGLALLAGLGASASAGTVILSQDTSATTGYSFSNGGEFDANIGAAVPFGYKSAGVGTIGDGTSLGAGTFQTFCLEYNEEFTPGNQYNYAVNANGWAIHGGESDHDAISYGTAELYYDFATQDAGFVASTGYVYARGAGRDASAGLLQQAIWYLEDENTGVPMTTALIQANPFLAFLGITSTDTSNQNYINAHADNNGAFGVSVMNLGPSGSGTQTTSDDFVNQDQLILHSYGNSLPDGGSTLMLMGFAMGGIAFIRRKLA